MLPLTDAALILQGGSFRCMFSAGALDVLMEHGLWFSYVNGVSAGALAGCNYLSRQNGRTRRVNETFCTDPDFLSLRNRFRAGGVFNFPFLFRDVGERIPMDWEALMTSPQRFEAVATDCLTGLPAYFSKDEVPREDFELACMASASMPAFSDMIRIRGVPYLDGGCACPIPINWALRQGFAKIVIVATREKGFRKKQPSQRMVDLYDDFYGDKPLFLATLLTQEMRYNALLDQIDALEDEGRICVIRPDEPVGIGRFEGSTEKLTELYIRGYKEMQQKLDGMMEYLEK